MVWPWWIEYPCLIRFRHSKASELAFLSPRLHDAESIIVSASQRPFALLVRPNRRSWIRFSSVELYNSLRIKLHSIPRCIYYSELIPFTRLPSLQRFSFPFYLSKRVYFDRFTLSRCRDAQQREKRYTLRWSFLITSTSQRDTRLTRLSLHSHLIVF